MDEVESFEEFVIFDVGNVGIIEFFLREFIYDVIMYCVIKVMNEFNLKYWVKFVRIGKYLGWFYWFLVFFLFFFDFRYWYFFLELIFC